MRTWLFIYWTVFFHIYILIILRPVVQTKQWPLFLEGKGRIKSRWCSYGKKKKKRLRYWKEYIFIFLHFWFNCSEDFFFKGTFFTSESCFDPYDQILNAKSRSWHVWEYRAAVCFSTGCTVLYQSNLDFGSVTTIIKMGTPVSQ